MFTKPTFKAFLMGITTKVLWTSAHWDVVWCLTNGISATRVCGAWINTAVFDTCLVCGAFIIMLAFSYFNYNQKQNTFRIPLKLLYLVCSTYSGHIDGRDHPQNLVDICSLLYGCWQNKLLWSCMDSRMNKGWCNYQNRMPDWASTLDLRCTQQAVVALKWAKKRKMF